MNNDNLIGTLALVHPGLENDPARKHGEVGVITYIGKENGEIYMSFPGGGEGVYEAGTVLSLKDKNEVLNTLVNDGDNMDVNDFKNLYKISILQDRGTSTGLLSALEIARDNPNIWDQTLQAANATEVMKLEKVMTR